MTRAKFMRGVSTEAALLLVGIPVLLWTLIPIYHMFLFAISPKDAAFSGQLWPSHPTFRNFEIVFEPEAPLSLQFLAPDVQFAGDLLRHRGVDPDDRQRRRLRHQPPAHEGRAHGDEPGAVHLLHPRRLPRGADVQDDGHVRPAQQRLGADPGDGDGGLALRHLDPAPGVGQAAGRARRGGPDRRRLAVPALPPDLHPADGAVADRRRHLCAPAGVERISLRLPAAVARDGAHPAGRAGQLPVGRRFAVGAA